MLYEAEVPILDIAHNNNEYYIIKVTRFSFYGFNLDFPNLFSNIQILKYNIIQFYKFGFYYFVYTCI